MPDVHNLTCYPAPRSRAWHLPDLIPSGELVLLDGATGVGKSAFLAYLAANLSRLEPEKEHKSILYVSSVLQLEDRMFHLKREGAVVENIHEMDYDNFQMTEGHLLSHFYSFLEKGIQEHKPRLVIIDQLEELLRHRAEPSLKDWQNFYTNLRLLVHRECCTIVIPRLHGTHEGRHFGPAAKAGTEFARHIVALQWHPHNANARVLTLSKRIQGEIGLQWHLHFQYDGKISLHQAELHEHVRPAKSPQTWMPDPEQLHASTEIMEQVEEKMQGKPILKKELQEYIVSRGFKKKEFLQVMSRAKLPSARKSVDWYYMPTITMAMKQYRLELEARAAEGEMADEDDGAVREQAA